jgi:hypothetical protein
MNESLKNLEAPPGFEPGIEDLQAACVGRVRPLRGHCEILSNPVCPLPFPALTVT